MGLQLSKGQNEGGKAIHIHGTDIELTSVYARIEFVAHADGKTVNVTFKTYKDRSYFDINQELYTDINTKSFNFAILETEEQSLAVALQYSILKFEDLGYSAVIV